MQVEPAGEDRVKIRYLFERLHRFEACQVAMRYVDKGEGPVQLDVHAENWLQVTVELPNELFILPEGSKAQ
ncbi:hypothetical protein [Streptomyces sp. URMC 125]|uniref:hypothetical protein n=1 Tax=Streptomyces sp. URMC 125 TaxID=3423419 RepID=UPI003F1ADFB4